MILFLSQSTTLEIFLRRKIIGGSFAPLHTPPPPCPKLRLCLLTESVFRSCSWGTTYFMAPQFYFSFHSVLSPVTALDQTCPRHAIPLHSEYWILLINSLCPHSSNFIIPSAHTMQFTTSERTEEHKEMYRGICLNNVKFNYTKIVVIVNTTFKQQLVFI